MWSEHCISVFSRFTFIFQLLTDEDFQKIRNMEAARALNMKASKKRKRETEDDEPPERLMHGLLYFLFGFFFLGGGVGAVKLMISLQ